MNLDALYSELTLKTNAKLALVVLDGLGDLATPAQGRLTPLEAAQTPNLDAGRLVHELVRRLLTRMIEDVISETGCRLRGNCRRRAASGLRTEHRQGL